MPICSCQKGKLYIPSNTEKNVKRLFRIFFIYKNNACVKPLLQGVETWFCILIWFVDIRKHL